MPALVARAELPERLRSIEPMLLGKAVAPFDDAGWTWELKYDGYRLLAWIGEGGARLKTRSGGDATAWFPEVVRGLAELPAGEHVLDGEVAVLDELGRTDFEKLHERARACRWKPGLSLVVYCVFDVLVHRGRDIRDLPLRRRQVCLDRLLAGGASSLLLVKGFEGQGVWLFRQACLLELEGVVGKKLHSPYVAGDRSAWLKVKRKGATPNQRFTRPARRGWEESS